METITLTTDKYESIAEDDQIEVTLNNIDFEEIVPQFKAEEMIRAISDHYDFSTIFDIVMIMKDEDDE